MAVTALVFGQFLGHLAKKRIDLDTDTIKVALATSAWTPNQDTNDFFDDVTNQVTGAGYTAGGATLTGVTWAYTAGTNTWRFDAADVSWPSSTITARYAVIYVETAGAASTDPLIAYVDFGADVSTTAGTFSIVWDSAGIFTVTVA